MLTDSSHKESLCNRYITIVALCYNQSRYVKESLDSILQQTWRPAHFFIIDDFSTDDSVEKINEWIEENHHPATLIRHTENWGITRTMNHALSLCKTKYFQPWPCDDLMMPDKTESQVKYLENLDWEPGFLYGDIQWIDDKSNVLRESVIANRKKVFPEEKMPEGNIFKELIQHGCFIPTASGMYVTRVLHELGGFDPNLFAEDWDMFLRIAQNHGIAFKDQVFSKYRRHSTSAEMVKGEKYWEGHFLILLKYINSDKAINKIIWNTIARDAQLAAFQKYPGAMKWLLKAALKTGNFGILKSFRHLLLPN